MDLGHAFKKLVQAKKVPSPKTKLPLPHDLAAIETPKKLSKQEVSSLLGVKVGSMNEFWTGFEKQAEAKANPEGHQLRRFFMGLPLSAAIEAKRGLKRKAAWEGAKQEFKGGLKGTGLGGAVGTLGGALASLASKGKVSPRQGALAGGMAGSEVGGVIGLHHARHGAKGSEIHGRYSKNK